MIKLVGHHSSVTKIQFGQNSNRNSTMLASCSNDQTIKLWTDPTQGLFNDLQLSATLPAQNSNVSEIAFTPLCDYLLFGTDQGELGVSHIESSQSTLLAEWDQCIKQIRVPRDGVISAVLKGDRSVCFYNLVKQNIFHNFDLKLHSIENLGRGNSIVRMQSIDFENKAGVLGIGRSDGVVKLLDLRQKEIVSDVKISDNSLNTLEFHPSEPFLLLVGDSAGCIKVD